MRAFYKFRIIKEPNAAHCTPEPIAFMYMGDSLYYATRRLVKDMCKSFVRAYVKKGLFFVPPSKEDKCICTKLIRTGPLSFDLTYIMQSNKIYTRSIFCDISRRDYIE